MSDAIILSIEMYAFAIVISMLVAVMIRVIVVSFGLFKDSSKASSASPVVTTSVAGEVPVAAIAAAVYAVVGPHRIVHISPASRRKGWKTEGRSSHHHSHNVPRRR